MRDSLHEAHEIAQALVVAPTPGATPAALASSVGLGEGPAFEEHVSDMALEHPIADGRRLGECVSGLAMEECPHHGQPVLREALAE
jgi:hypothetical protein